MPRPKLAIVASPVPIAQTALRELAAKHGDVPQAEADVIVALGGDGFMLQTLVATPAGSTAYNYSAHGPILPIGSDVLALTAMSAFRPRRWRGALLPKKAVVRFDVIDPGKRPVMADADGKSARDVVSVEIRSEPTIAHRILFDPGHGLEERLIREQFA